MTQSDLKDRVRSLNEGELVTIDTNRDIQDRDFTVERIAEDEYHTRDGGRHYRVYLSGSGNQKGQGTYVITLDHVDWAARRSNHPAPELFYIDNETSSAGEDERTEGAITAIR